MIKRAYKKNFQNNYLFNDLLNKEKLYTTIIAKYDQTAGCTNITPQNITTSKPTGLLVNSTLWSFLLVFLKFSLFFVVIAVVVNCFKVLIKEIKCILLLYKRNVCSIKEQQIPLSSKNLSRQQADAINASSEQQCQQDETKRQQHKNGVFYAFLITSQIICGLVQSVCTLCFLVISKSCNDVSNAWNMVECVMRSINFTHITSLVAFDLSSQCQHKDKDLVLVKSTEKNDEFVSNDIQTISNISKTSNSYRNIPAKMFEENISIKETTNVSPFRGLGIKYTIKMVILFLFSWSLGGLVGWFPFYEFRRNRKEYSKADLLLLVTITSHLMPLIFTFVFYLIYKIKNHENEARIILNDRRINTPSVFSSVNDQRSGVKSPSVNVSNSQFNAENNSLNTITSKETIFRLRNKKNDFSTLTLAGSFYRKQRLSTSSSVKKRASLKNKTIKESPKLDRHPSLRYSIKRKRSVESINLISLKKLEQIEKKKLSSKASCSDTGKFDRKNAAESRLKTLKNKSSNFLSVDNSPTYKSHLRQFDYLNSQDDNDDDEDSKTPQKSSSSVFLKPLKLADTKKKKKYANKSRMSSTGSGNESNKSSRSSSRSDRSSDESHPSLKFSTRRNINSNKIFLESLSYEFINSEKSGSRGRFGGSMRMDKGKKKNDDFVMDKLFNLKKQKKAIRPSFKKPFLDKTHSIARGFERHPSMRFSTKKNAPVGKKKTLSWASVALDDKSNQLKRKSKLSLLTRETPLGIDNKKEVLFRHFKTSDKNKPKIHRITSFYLNKTLSNIFVPKSNSFLSLNIQKETESLKRGPDSPQASIVYKEKGANRAKRIIKHCHSFNQARCASEIIKKDDESGKFYRSSLRTPSIGRKDYPFKNKNVLENKESFRTSIEKLQIEKVDEETKEYLVDVDTQQVFIYKNIQKTIENLALINFFYYLPLSIAFVIWYLFLASVECSEKFEVIETIIAAALCFSYSFVVVRSSIVVESLKI